MEEMILKVENRLLSLNYQYEMDDISAIEYDVSRAAEILKSRINQDTVPEGLTYVWIDMAAGLFLQSKRQLGALTPDSDAPIKSITEGDTSVSYAVSESTSPAKLLEKMIDDMINPSEAVIARFRKVAW